MEIGETPVQLPVLSEINREIDTIVNATVRKKLEEILTNLSDQEQIPRDYLFKKYLTTVDPIKKPRKNVPDENRCRALIASGERCSKQQQKDKKFCGNHISSRRFGEYKSSPDSPGETEY